jgi:hypothetical protein
LTAVKTGNQRVLGDVGGRWHREFWVTSGRQVAAFVSKAGLKGASVVDAGTVPGFTEGAVRVTLHRALKSLADLRERHAK